MARKIYISDQDQSRLEDLIAMSGAGTDPDRQDLDALAAELKRATIVAAADIPPDVVTMNSRVVLRDLDSEEQMTYVLAFPQDANIDLGRISILAPIGTAILGYAKGDVIKWVVPSGTRRIRVDDIPYQPEAAGDHHL